MNLLRRIGAILVIAVLLLGMWIVAATAAEGDIEPNMAALNRIIDQINATDSDANLPRIDFDDNSNWSDTVRALQRYLGTTADAQFGPASITAYKAWATRNGVQAVELQDVRGIREIISWIMCSHRASSAQTASIGTWLAIMYYESYLDAKASPFGRMKQPKSSTATGLMQITHSTAVDIVERILKLIAVDKEDLELEKAVLAELGWNPDKPSSIRDVLESPCLNVYLAMTLFYYDTAIRGQSRDDALKRWEAWTKYNSAIKDKAEKIDKILSDWLATHPDKSLLDLDSETEQQILSVLRGS